MILSIIALGHFEHARCIGLASSASLMNSGSTRGGNTRVSAVARVVEYALARAMTRERRNKRGRDIDAYTRYEQEG